MKISELQTAEFEKLKKEAEIKRFIQLLKNVELLCAKCPIRKDCILPIKQVLQ